MSADLLHLDPYPDLILHNARIYTMEPEQSWAEAIAIRAKTIIAIGSNTAILALAGPHTRQIDVQGQLVLPGLCDAHIHLYEWSINLTRPHLASATNKAEMLAQIATYASALPSHSWIVCHGWNESWWGETQFPTADDLDAVTQPGQPAIAYRSDMHIAIANHAALSRAGITSATPNPPSGLIDRDAAGNPTGVLRELAIGLVTMHITNLSQVELAEIVRVALPELHRLGITAIHDQRVKDANEGPQMLAVYNHLNESQALHLRVNCNIAAHDLPFLKALGLRSGFGNDYVRLGHVKIFADGSLGSRTAWMLEPFVAQSTTEQANYGVNVTPPEQMAAEFYQAQQLGFPISAHAIGDRANRVVLDIFEELAPQLPPLPIPHRIEHVQTIADADIPRLAQLNISASVQPIHLTDDRDLTDRYWGKRARTTYAFRLLLDSGARLVFGSDAPVADPNPFLGIHAALIRRRPHDAQTSWQPQETLPLEEIIRAYTLGAAEAAGWDATIGSLTPGKRADLIVLDRDLFTLAQDPNRVDEIAATEIVYTCFDGEIVYQHPSK